jgi:hypothetical protein
MPPLDFTAELVQPNIDRTLPHRELAHHFSPAVHSAERGVYILYFENSSADPVFDKNGKGKLVIPAGGASLKPGKFEGGFIARRRQDADHLHRTPGDQFGATFKQCLRLALALDLSGRSTEVTRATEQVLKEAVDAFIIGPPRLLHAAGSRRGDWRHLTGNLPLDALRTRLWDILAIV